jgi:NAD(P)H-dependent FMN reductase
MATLLHILGISGGLYEKSYNTAALHAAQQLLPEDITMGIFAYLDTDVQR